MASFGEAQESKLPLCLRNKNLYLGFTLNSRILRIELKGQLEFLGNKKPVIIRNPVFGEWDIHKDDGVPIGMNILVKNSKVYAIGGSNHSDGKPCNGRIKECLLQPLSMLVYEFTTLGDDGGRPSFRPCSSVPQLPVPQLPVGMNAPYIVKHMGKTYVLYGPDMVNQGLSPEDKRLVLEKYSFMVLEKNGMEWKSLPCVPLFCDPYRAIWMECHGVIGSKLYVSAKRRLFGYDINKKQWEDSNHLTWNMVESGAITLSSLSTTITNELGKPSYVVIYAVHDYDYNGHAICAALVDEDGIVTRRQDILEATGKYSGVHSYKLIELSFKRGSSTFALVFTEGGMIGLTVVEVSLIPGFSEGDAFLKEKVLVNQRYVMEDRLICDTSIIEDAFFC